MPTLTRQQLITLTLLTVIWGFNWPVMKLGVQHFPPLAFRAVCMLIGLPVLALAMVALKIPFRLERQYWPRLLLLGLLNMLLWNALIIIAIPMLPSGRAAILGYTMPIFSAMLGTWFFSDRVPARGWAGIAAAATGVLLLLWNEFDKLGGRPTGVALMLLAAASWALGTQLLRRSKLPVHTLTLVFWMTVMTAITLCSLTTIFEQDRWHAPDTIAWGAILFNAFLVFGYAQSAWFLLVRSLPPVASTLSIMLIPVIGVFSGAFWLQEKLHWQDWTAVALMVVAIVSVLWPSKEAGKAAA